MTWTDICYAVLLGLDIGLIVGVLFLFCAKI
jgi:hypothetical protein